MSASPSTSTTFSISQRRQHTPVSIDLSALPPLLAPSPESNTLLITNLQDAASFRPDSLDALRRYLDRHAPTSVHSFSPLKSFRRIVVSFNDIPSAVAIRSLLDGVSLSLLAHPGALDTDLRGPPPVQCSDRRVRIYFGAPTPLHPHAERHLQAPKIDKLFFISPPASPPHYWEPRLEDEPNKQVHADDLAQALSRLHPTAMPAAVPTADAMEIDQPQLSPSLESPLPASPTTGPSDAVLAAATAASVAESSLLSGSGATRRRRAAGGHRSNRRRGRGRTATDPSSPTFRHRTRNNNGRHRSAGAATTIVYNPEYHGCNSSLPSIAVEDLTASPESQSPLVPTFSLMRTDRDEDHGRGRSMDQGHTSDEGSVSDESVHSDDDEDAARGRGRILAHTPRPPVELMDHH